ncbi:MAG: Zn-ribbon domain-containing OB-fold protein [Candidatus Lokiarchaeota archaeon]|nr:Zn-ribbon domain-containing OB-fold protein [Candidatus Lokiarchaeota archaeon]
MSEKEITVYNYLDYINQKKLMGSKCKSCGELFAPPRKLCTKCGSTEMEWTEMSGKGKIAAFTCISVGTKFFVDKGYSKNKPYCFSVIKLDEGPMVSAQLVGVDESKPETIEIDTPVKVKFLETPLPGENPRIDLGFEPL